MRYKYVYFFIVIVQNFSTYSLPGTRTESLEEIEYKICGMRPSSGEKVEIFEEYKEIDSNENETRMMNNCCICLACTPCFMFIASFFIN